MEACVECTNGLRRGIVTHCQERTRQQRLPDEHPTLWLQCEEAWLAAHSATAHRRQHGRRILSPQAMEPDGSDWFVPARASDLESEMDAVLRAASPSSGRAESLTEEIIRHRAKAFSKIFGEIGPGEGDALFNASLDEGHENPRSQGNVAASSSELDPISFDDAEPVDAPASEESIDSNPFAECRQRPLSGTDPGESVQLSEDLYSCSSQDDDGDAEMDFDATVEDSPPQPSTSSPGSSFFNAQSASSLQPGDGERSSLQSPPPEHTEMPRFVDHDTMDCDNLQVEISIAEDRMAILEAQIWDMAFLLDQKIAEQARKGNTSMLSLLAACIAGVITKILSLFGVGRTEVGENNDRTGTQTSPDPNSDWDFMDADEIEQEMGMAQAKLEALERQVTNMQNAFSRKMLVRLVERLIVAHRMLDRRWY